MQNYGIGSVVWWRTEVHKNMHFRIHMFLSLPLFLHCGIFPDPTGDQSEIYGPGLLNVREVSSNFNSIPTTYIVYRKGQDAVVGQA